MISDSVFILSVLILISCGLLRLMFNKIGWHEVYRKLHELFTGGFKNPAPFIYFISIVVFCGGIGIWVSFYQQSYEVSNITTYVFALISSLMVDLMITNQNINDDNKFTDKDLLMIIVGSVLFTLGMAVAAALLDKKHLHLKWYMSTISLLCTWYLWWILSSCDKKFGPTKESIRISTIGSEPTSEVQGGGLADLEN